MSTARKKANSASKVMPTNPKRQGQKPNDWPQHKSKNRKRPTDNEQQEPEKELEHRESHRSWERGADCARRLGVTSMVAQKCAQSLHQPPSQPR